MPTPTLSDMHANRPLANFTVAALQSDLDFVCMRAAPFLPVDKKSDQYYVYDTGAMNRLEMRRRAPGTESAGGGWSLSTSSYDCKLDAVHKDFAYDDIANADEAIEPERDARVWGQNQVRLQADYLFASNCFAQSKWTSDISGVNSGATQGTDVLQWDDTTSDPQRDIYYWSSVIKGRIGLRPNLLIAGADVHTNLVTNAQFRDATKHTEFTGVRAMQQKIAAYLGVDEYVEASGFYNSAAEGASTVIAKLLNAKSMLLVYKDETVGKHVMTGARTFAWKRDGTASNGVSVRTLDVPLKQSTRYEFELSADVKVVTADAGVFFYDVVP